MNIAEILKVQSERSPDAMALIESRRGKDRQYSFAELDKASARAATLLSQQGLKKGDAVLVFLPVSIDLYIALIAIFRLGLVAMFLDPSAGRTHIKQCCRLHPPKGFIGTDRSHLLRLISPALRRIPYKFSVGHYVPGATHWRAIDKSLPFDCIVQRAGDAPALITFTSGSTGQPKGAVRTHDFLIAQHQALQKSLALESGQLDLSTLPIFVLANLASGVTSLIPDADLRRPAEIDAHQVYQQISRFKPERTAGSPAFYECLIAYCRQRACLLPSFKKIYTGGAPVFPRILRELQELSPIGEIIAVYGSTEAEPIAHIAYSEISTEDIQGMMQGKGLLTGCPVPHISLRIIKMQWGKPLGVLTRDEFEREALAEGETGEIVVSGDHVLKGYLNGVGDKDSKFDVGEQRWHRTGDAGYLDVWGRLWLMGRCAALIRDSKGCLYPFAVESAAMHCPGVYRAALIQHENERLLLLQETARGDCDLEALLHTLHWAQLDNVRVLDVIPMDKRHNAKVDYPALREKLAVGNV